MWRRPERNTSTDFTLTKEEYIIVTGELMKKHPNMDLVYERKGEGWPHTPASCAHRDLDKDIDHDRRTKT